MNAGIDVLTKSMVKHYREFARHQFEIDQILTKTARYNCLGICPLFEHCTCHGEKSKYIRLYKCQKALCAYFDDLKAKAFKNNARPAKQARRENNHD
jgi:hypothetical protein